MNQSFHNAVGRTYLISTDQVTVLVQHKGMAAMSISASFPTCAGPDCLQDGSSKSFVFFLGLYLMAIGAGGIKPCVSSFGADQFDDSNPAERLKKDSFFNWFFFAIYIGSFVSGTVVVWAQDHFGWVVGLWIPTLFIALAITSFVLGSSSYTVQKPMGSPIVRVFQVIVAAVRKWDVGLPNDDSLLHELLQEKASMADGDKLQHTPVLRSLPEPAVICERSFHFQVQSLDVTSKFVCFEQIP
jgi:peptide/histidine transporter 3/4